MSDKVDDVTPRYTADETLYMKYIRRRSAAGNWFIFFRDYLDVMSRDEALVIQCISNAGQRKPKNKYRQKMLKNGYVLCTVSYLRKMLRMESGVQKRTLLRLKDKGFINVRQCGMPAKRFVSIDVLAIEKAIDEAEEQTLSDSARGAKNGRPKGGQKRTTLGRLETAPLGGLETAPNKYKVDKNERKSNCRPLRADGETPGFSHLLDGHSTNGNGKQEPPSKAMRFAVRLKDMLDAKRRLMRRPDLRKWAASIEELLKVRSSKEVRAVLDWLEGNLMDAYTPKVCSAESLFKKFADLERAMETKKQKEQGDDHPPEWYAARNMIPRSQQW